MIKVDRFRFDVVSRLQSLQPISKTYLFCNCTPKEARNNISNRKIEETWLESIKEVEGKTSFFLC